MGSQKSASDATRSSRIWSKEGRGELCYAASEASFEGEAFSTQSCIRARNCRGVFGGVEPADPQRICRLRRLARRLPDRQRIYSGRIAAPFQVPAFDDEEISDVSLATFSLFENELGNSRSGVELAAFRGCGCGHGCGGCRGAAADFEAAAGCRGCWRWRLPRLRRWGLPRLQRRLRWVRLRRLRRLAGAGAGAAAAACRGEVAPSGARAGALCDYVDDAGVVRGFDQVRPGHRILFAALPGDARVWRAKNGGGWRALSRNASARA